MQSKAFSLLSAAAVLATLGVPSAESAPPTCVHTTQPSGINCSPANSIEDIQQFLQSLSAGSGAKDFEVFEIQGNNRIQYLPVGLLNGLRFSKVNILGCSQLSRVEDFVGTAGASLREVKMYDNALTEVPTLSAPNLVKVEIFQPTPFAVRREAFKGMTKIEELSVNNAHVKPYAFLDLKNLKNLRVTGMSSETVAQGTFHFASPVLQEVLLLNDRGWKGEAQVGAYDGFVKGSRLKIVDSPDMPRDLYFNVLNSGAILEIPEPVHCECNVAWMRLAPFVSNAQIRCHTSMWPLDLESTPESDYADCPRN